MALPGVNLLGYLGADLGLGEIARGYASALRTLGAPLAELDLRLSSQSPRTGSAGTRTAGKAKYRVNLICVNPPELPPLRAEFGRALFFRRYTIGAWWWELPAFPAGWEGCAGLFDEIWVGSAFVQQAIRSGLNLPVAVVPPVLAPPGRGPGPGRQTFGLPEDEFCFLFIYDFLSVFERKNPLAAIQAFRRAFRPDEPVRLVLKSLNGGSDPQNLQRLKTAAGDARITLIDRALPRDEKDALVGLCDAYVSLHRSEGFGLTLAEAMLQGKPVVATGWSGNMDFMTPQNSYPVRFRLAPLERDFGPYRQGMTWAEPDVDHAAELLRRVYRERDGEARAVAAAGAATIAARYSVEAAAAAMRARLEQAPAGPLALLGREAGRVARRLLGARG